MSDLDFGVDLSCTDDLDENGREVTGVDVVREAAHRRLRTRRGVLLTDPDYGFDLLELLGAEATMDQVSQLPNLVSAELRKDDRIASVEVVTRVDQTTGELALELTGTTALGPFNLILPVDGITVALLKG